jgi:nicotinamidase-related amidase
MANLPVRDPIGDHLLTPQNVAMFVIDASQADRVCALWTEICMAFPALDALRDGYDVYPVVDAIGGTSEEAHRAGLEQVVQAGGRPISWVALACELQRDWARQETVQEVVQISSWPPVPTKSRSWPPRADGTVSRTLPDGQSAGEVVASRLPQGTR